MDQAGELRGSVSSTPTAQAGLLAFICTTSPFGDAFASSILWCWGGRGLHVRLRCGKDRHCKMTDDMDDVDDMDIEVEEMD